MPWWLDAVCGEENWDVLLLKRNEKVTAVWPYFFKRTMGRNIFSMPQLTQYLGIWIDYPENQKLSSRYRYEQDICAELIESFPQYVYFRQNFSCQFINWLPFYWKGFRQSTNYTYVLENIADPQQLLSLFAKDKKHNVKVARENNIEVHQHLDVKQYYSYHKKHLNTRGKKISFSEDFFMRIHKAVYEHNAGMTLYALDEKSNIHACIFIIWDQESAFFLTNAWDPALQKSGALALLIYEGIKVASARTKRFDFEGSMIKGTNESYRKYGAVQKPYFNIYKINSKVLKAYFFLKNILQ